MGWGWGGKGNWKPLIIPTPTYPHHTLTHPHPHKLGSLSVMLFRLICFVFFFSLFFILFYGDVPRGVYKLVAREWLRQRRKDLR